MTRIPWILSSTYNFRWHVFKSEICFYFRFNYIWLGVMVYNAIFNNISVILSMAVSFISRGNWSVRGKPQTWEALSHHVVSSRSRQNGIRTHNFSGDINYICEHKCLIIRHLCLLLFYNSNNHEEGELHKYWHI